MKIVVNKSGELLTFDSESYDLFMSRKWYIGGQKNNRYLRRSENNETTTKTILFHTELMKRRGPWDHINGDSLDNRISNLRKCTTQENNLNRARPNRTSRYLGVCRHSSGKGWNTKVTKNKKTVFCGFFQNEEEAARARDKAAREHFGEFARLNFTVKIITDPIPS